MEVYVVQGETGQYEDKVRFLLYVGANKEDAIKEAFKCMADVTFFSVWEEGIELTEYYRDGKGKWERNMGIIMDIFEHKE